MQDNCSKGIPTELYLASKSPRRREILSQIGVKFTSIAVDVEECRSVNEVPEAYIRRLALEKAQAGWRILQHNECPLRPVLSADTVGLFNGQVLEKPRNKEHFIEVMRMLSGQTHCILTAVAITDGIKQSIKHTETNVTFRQLTEKEIIAYWETGEPQDKACGYGIQGLGAVFVASISGSYTGIVGLPIEIVAPLLAQFNVPWWHDLSSVSLG